MKIAWLPVTSELIKDALHLPDGITIVGADADVERGIVHLLLIGDPLPDDAEHREGVMPRDVTAICTRQPERITVEFR